MDYIGLWKHDDLGYKFSDKKRNLWLPRSQIDLAEWHASVLGLLMKIKINEATELVF